MPGTASPPPSTAPPVGGVDRVFFPNLNSVRCFAAAMVVVHHIEQLRQMHGLPNHWQHPVVAGLGPRGVGLFFVLSGFLITFLLVHEERTLGGIDLRSFYLRRILRIWPLYFLIVLSALFLIPQVGFLALPGLDPAQAQAHLGSKLTLFALLCPNLVNALYGPVPYAGQTWSIGIEEQFYLFWPLLLILVRQRWLLVIGTVAAYTAVRLAMPQDRQAFPVLHGFIRPYGIDGMVVGAAFALLVQGGDGRLRRLAFHSAIQAAAWTLALAGLATGWCPTRFGNLGYALVFGIIIVNLAANPRRLFGIDLPGTSYLGKISYGLYMYHPLAIGGAIAGLGGLEMLAGWSLHLTAGIGTIALAMASYHGFERPFMDLKARFGRIRSGGG